ncbi:MAG: radical SAM protein [Deltaproteobacteria bacterium]|nr:radical SAM protein [Deltaproteobacteria bacterium]
MPEHKAEQSFEPAYVKLGRQELARRAEALAALLSPCRLCPRACKARRSEGQLGTCRTDGRVRLASFGPHFGEEPPLVGRAGSGTIFFSNCNLLCIFCQNWEIAHRGEGRYTDDETLAEVMLSLQERGCHNINLVTPTHQAPQILRSLCLAAARGLRLPLVYNCGGYESLEVIRLLDGIVDIYMPDFKYQDGAQAARFSSGAEDYPERAAEAIAEMHRQVGVLQIDERGVARRGVVLRHLVMPHNIAGTDRFARWVSEKLSPDTYVNIMAQYHPCYKAFDHPEIARRLHAEEFEQALRWAREAGLRRLARG